MATTASRFSRRSQQAQDAVGSAQGARSRLRRPTRQGGKLAAVVWATALAIVASTAHGADDPIHKYHELSAGLHWSGNTMSWYYAPTGQPGWANASNMVPLIQQAMNAWT